MLSTKALHAASLRPQGAKSKEREVTEGEPRFPLCSYTDRKGEQLVGYTPTSGSPLMVVRCMMRRCATLISVR